VGRVPWGLPLWSGVGKPGDLRDHPADKISVCLDQGPEIRRICWPDHWTVVLLPLLNRFLIPSYYAPL